MGFREVLEFVKVEHTLFSLPFVLIGFVIADKQFESESMDLVWIIVAAIGARGLAMALNRIVDRDIDAENPRTATRHLPSGTMSMQSAWMLTVAFLGILLFAAWRLNDVALKMAWLPVLAFVIYPYTKRISWICHFWIGLCLALAPAGAWVAIAADTHGWAAITGMLDGSTDFLWYPEIFFISLGVALWITAFDINYASMDQDTDRRQGIHSFPSRTRPLSPAARMVLPGRSGGRVRRRQRICGPTVPIGSVGLFCVVVSCRGYRLVSIYALLFLWTRDMRCLS